MEIEYNNRPNCNSVLLTTTYSRLPDTTGISMSNADIDRGTSNYRWNYGTGFARPLGNISKPYTQGLLSDYTQYIMPNAVYDLPTTNQVKMFRESEFNPPIATPEEAKLIQGKQTLNNR